MQDMAQQFMKEVELSICKTLTLTLLKNIFLTKASGQPETTNGK